MADIIIDNPTGLPMLPLDEIRLFQGDLKLPPTPTDMDKLKRSILDHHLFIAKAVFFEDGIAYTEDGHQTLKALYELVAAGYSKSTVITYSMVDGRYSESERAPYDTIMIPYQVIVPRGATPEARRRDAAEKLLQINSQYAKINPETTFFEDIGFSMLDLDDLLSKISVPDFDIPDLKEEDEFRKEFESYDDANCIYHIVPKFSERYDAVIIVSDNETDTAFLKTVLELGKEQTYKNIVDEKNGGMGTSMVITAKRFGELWKSRS
jgi:hypothetical protein